MDESKRDLNKTSGGLSRREFIRSASLAATTALALPSTFGAFTILTRKASAQPPPERQIRVVVVRDFSSHQGSQIVSDITRVMMDEAIRRYTGMPDVGEAYKSVFRNIRFDSVVGIKVNCINTDLSTHPAVVDALVGGLQQMRLDGMPFPDNHIIIWDRYSNELQAAGYTLNSSTTGVRCFGTDAVGFNTSINLNCAGTIQHPSRILTDYVDYNVDFAVLKNSGEAGLTLTLKNNYGCVDAPYNLHSSNCNPGIPAVNQQIRDVLDVRESLFIVDAIFGAYYGGPSGPPNMEYDGIILGQDRVAVDSIGRSILNEFGCPTLANSVHVDTAAEPPYSLGTNDLEAIHRIDVTNPSIPVEDLRVIPSDRNIALAWSAPEYTGYFSVRRSRDSNFSTHEEIAKIRGWHFVDRRAINQSHKYFYRVLKTW